MSTEDKGMMEVRLFYREGSSLQVQIPAGDIPGVIIFDGLYFHNANGQYREATASIAVRVPKQP